MDRNSPSEPRPVLIAQRTQLTAVAIDVEVAAAVVRLRSAGVRPDQRVALALDESADAVVALLALARLGCSVLVVDPGQFADLDSLISRGAPDRLILPRAERRLAADHGAALVCTPLSHVADLEPGLLRGDGDGDPRALVESAWWDRPDGLVLTSSGSTGGPKAIPKTPRDMIANGAATAEFLGYDSGDVLQPLLPLSHQYGLSVLVIGLTAGLPVVVSPFRRPIEAARFGRRWGATVLETVPQNYEVLVHAVDQGRLPLATLSGLRLLGVGGGLVPVPLHAAAVSVLGRPLLDGYGSTEFGNIALARPSDPRGGLRTLPGVDLRVVDEDGIELAAGDSGRLEVRPDRDAPWGATGDLARLDASGALTVLGRFGALNRNGLLVHPAAVEHRLGEEGVSAVAVAYGPPESPRYALVIEDRIRRPRAWWARRVAAILAENDRPDRLLVRAELPSTPTGKVDRASLGRLVEAVAHEVGAAADPLSALADELVRRRAEVVAIMVGYSARPAAEIEFDAAIAALRGGAAETIAERPGRIPRSWVHLPSNVVLYSYVLYLLIPSAWTDAAVFRPSSRSREATLALHALLSSVHDARIEAFEGSQRDFEHSRRGRSGLIVFTGRHGNAEQVRASLGPAQVLVYFGQGTNPIVVGPDADIALAARDTVRMRLLNSGQDCFGPDLIAVHREVADEFLADLTARLESESLESLLAGAGDTVRGTTDEIVLHDVVQHVSRHRSAVRAGGRIDLPTGIVEPTLLVWPIGSAPLCSEVFAPVFNVLVYTSEAECRGLLDSDFYRARHMGASLYGTSDAFAHWCADRMTVAVGATLVAVDDPHEAFGGVGEIAGYLATTDGLRTGALLLSRVAREFAGALGERERQEEVVR